MKLFKLKSSKNELSPAPVSITRLDQNATYVAPAQNQPKEPQLPKKHWFWRVEMLWIVIIFGVVVFGAKTADQTLLKPSAPPAFNKSQYSINDPGSIWAVVNKGRVLLSGYVPPDLVLPNVPLRLPSSDPEMQLRKVAADALAQMFAAANAQNINLMLLSGYRSFDEQTGIYNNFVGVQGQQNTDASSAKPGYSEHQLGLAADVEPTNRNCEADPCFASTSESQWLAANSYKYGFIIRYPSGKENLTGYEYEPWHVRYVGIPLALQLRKTSQTVEQFFGLPAVNDYPANPYQLTAGK